MSSVATARQEAVRLMYLPNRKATIQRDTDHRQKVGYNYHRKRNAHPNEASSVAVVEQCLTSSSLSLCIYNVVKQRILPQHEDGR